MNKKKDMSIKKEISKAQSWFNIIKAIIIVITILSSIICNFGLAKGEENKCRNYCCTMFIKVIGVIIKHEGKEDEKILHSRTCELLDNYDSHNYLICSELEIAFSKGFVKCEHCNLEAIDSDPCVAKCCKYYGWAIEPMTGILHRKECQFLSIVKVRMYQGLAFICSRHNTEEVLIDKALVERKANYRICNFCFRDIIPKRFKLQPGLLRYYESGDIEYSLDALELCLTTLYR
ncbi:MAG: hypothetical protein ACYSTS_07840 [Planctomycetota bacterium]|jgi:hypothetical protein